MVRYFSRLLRVSINLFFSAVTSCIIPMRDIGRSSSPLCNTDMLRSKYVICFTSLSLERLHLTSNLVLSYNPASIFSISSIIRLKSSSGKSRANVFRLYSSLDFPSLLINVNNLLVMLYVHTSILPERNNSPKRFDCLALVSLNRLS